MPDVCLWMMVLAHENIKSCEAYTDRVFGSDSSQSDEKWFPKKDTLTPAAFMVWDQEVPYGVKRTIKEHLRKMRQNEAEVRTALSPDPDS
eukprot:7881597-Karenia_brevis.AAC.1